MDGPGAGGPRRGLALRARIVLACAEGRSNTAVAARLGISRTTVRKWRDRFLAWRLDGLGDEPRPGVPRTISDAQVKEVVVRTLEEVPEGATHWSERELAAAGTAAGQDPRSGRTSGLAGHRDPAGVQPGPAHGAGPLAAGYVLDADALPDEQAGTTEQELLAAEQQAALRQAFRDLPPCGQRLIALLLEDPPVPYAEISARLGIPVGSIGPNRGRCLDKPRRHRPSLR